eukprot:Lithocolla_globosa_v1_NODE_7647_length_918_cov_65.638232.p1 type:complete len:287 gc:universal NODE_7647_length_918_cov_65.638232:2-862(+)
MCLPLELTDIGVRCLMLEYDRDVDVFLPLNQLSRRRIRSINKVVRIGRNTVCQVLTVDSTKKAVVVSIKTVTQEDRELCESNFVKAKHLKSIVKRVSEVEGLPILQLFEDLIWPLAARLKDKHVYDLFRLSLEQPALLWENPAIEGKVSPKLQSILKAEIKKRMETFASDHVMEIEMMCTGEAGVVALVEAAKAAEELSTPEQPLNVRVVAAPSYIVWCRSKRAEEAVVLLQQVEEVMTKTMSKYEGGHLKVKQAPRIVQTDTYNGMFAEGGQSSGEGSSSEDEEP